ncbi:MAG: hypothetical protein QG670_2550 [Thermoproteota archaeon]|nr:hypothetical protein [Thermoproteota archaeon]
MAQGVLQIKNKLNNKLIDQIEIMSFKTTQLFEGSINAFFEKDYKKAESLIKRRNEVISIQNENTILTIKDCNHEEVNIRLIIESLKRIAEYSCDIVETVLNMSIQLILE